MRTIYLDYCTSTPVASSVRESMLPFLGEFFGHPSSSHWYGRAAQEAIEDARSNVASLLECHPAEIVFTSGGTESVNVGLLGLAKAIEQSVERPHMLTTCLEHTCVQRCADYLATCGWEIASIGCDSDGVIDLEQLEDSIQDRTRIISVIHASHRIGTIQPVEEVAMICQDRDILLHTDASQSFGKLDCGVDKLGVDMLSLSGHKCYAPKGIGALYVRTGVPVEPILFGEGCEAGIRPGTANVPHIVGLGQACKILLAGMENSQNEMARTRDLFIQKLEDALKMPLIVHGQEAKRIPGLLSFELPGVSSDALQQMLPEVCFGASATNGNGQHNGRTINATHGAIGLSAEQSASTHRVSFGWNTTQDEVIQAAQMIASAYDSLI